MLCVHGVVCVTTLLFLAAATDTRSSTHCARFELPNLQANKTVTAAKGSELSIDFQFIFDKNCSKDQVFALVSRVESPSSPFLDDYCIVMFEKSKRRCQSFSEGRCHCQDGGQSRVLLTKTVREEDAGIWVWKTRGDFAPTFSLELNVVEHTPTTPSPDQETTTSTHTTDILTTVAEHSKTSGITSTDITTRGGGGGDGVKHDEDNNDDSGTSTTVAAPPVDMSHVGAVVAAVNVSTIVVIGIIVVLFRVVCVRMRKRSGRRTRSPTPCVLDHVGTTRRGQQLFSSVQYAPFDKSSSATSSRIYDEIPPLTPGDNPQAACTVVLPSTDSSTYLTPVLTL